MPSGATAIATGLSPTPWITAPAAFVATSTGVIESPSPLATYAVFPSGVIATAVGAAPTPIGAAGTLPAVSSGVTALPATM